MDSHLIWHSSYNNVCNKLKGLHNPASALIFHLALAALLCNLPWQGDKRFKELVCPWSCEFSARGGLKDNNLPAACLYYVQVRFQPLQEAFGANGCRSNPASYDAHCVGEGDRLGIGICGVPAGILPCRNERVGAGIWVMYDSALCNHTPLRPSGLTHNT